MVLLDDNRIEPTIVQNLENVQGDERDVIMFSITFWKDMAGKLTMDFGALNRDGGERRLNVAVTRARRELIVFSGVHGGRDRCRPVEVYRRQHLKTFLDYAERGAIALPAADHGSVGGFEFTFRGGRCSSTGAPRMDGRSAGRHLGLPHRPRHPQSRPRRGVSGRR